MNPIVKRLAPKVAAALVRGPIKRILDRRAAKGGKLVLWWRRTFGELDTDRFADDLARAIRDDTMPADEADRQFGSYIERLNRGESPKVVAADYVRQLERNGRVKR